MIYSHEETADARNETDRRIEETERIIAALDGKFGDFIDSIDISSMDKVFCDDIGLDVVQPRARSRSPQNGQTMQIDVLAYDYPGGSKDVYVVNAARHLTERDIEWVKEMIEDFPNYFPWGRDRTVYGVIAGVDIPDNVRKKILKEGLYLARINRGIFTMQAPRGFKPKAFYPGAKLEVTSQKKKEAPAERKRAKKVKGR